MPIFYYKSIDSQSKCHKGFIDAHSEQEAKDKLRAFGLMVVELRTKAFRGFTYHLTRANVLLFTSQLTQLLQAGLPLYESLITLEEQHRGEKLQGVLLRLCDKIKAGVSLSEALNFFPDSFDPLYCAMIAAGEKAGNIENVLHRLSDLLTKQQKVRKQLMGALLYPMILGVFCVILVILMVTVIVPSLEMFFEGRELKPFTLMVLSTCTFLRCFWWVYLPLFFLSGAFIVVKLRTSKWQLKKDRLLCRLPILRHFLIEMSLFHFVHTLANLLEGGVNLIEALAFARGVVSNTLLKTPIMQAEKKLAEGCRLSDELAKSPIIPTIMVKMLIVGEESGSLDNALRKLSEIYEDKVSQALNRLTQLASPLLLLIMGVIIGAIMLAILLPLTDVSSFTSG